MKPETLNLVIGLAPVDVTTFETSVSLSDVLAESVDRVNVRTEFRFGGGVDRYQGWSRAVLLLWDASEVKRVVLL